jgi:hypothetical protein
MNGLQAKMMLEHPELYDCDCHLREDASAIILEANTELIKITHGIRELSILLRKKMEG